MEQFRKQRWIGVDPAEACGEGAADTVEVAAKPDVVAARDLRDMLDMVGDHRQRYRRLGVGLLPLDERCRRLVGLADE